MEFPLVSRELLADLRLLHGIFNFAVLFLFLYQARLGLQIRRARLAKAPLLFTAVKRHRKEGPLFTGLAAFGYVFGIVVVLLDTGNLLEYAAHFTAGTLLVLVLSVVVFLSRRIKGQQSPYRRRHFVAAAVLLGIFVLQVLLGLGILF